MTSGRFGGGPGSGLNMLQIQGALSTSKIKKVFQKRQNFMVYLTTENRNSTAYYYHATKY